MIDGLLSLLRLVGSGSSGSWIRSRRMPFMLIFTLLPRFQLCFVTEYNSGLGGAFVLERRVQISKSSLLRRSSDEPFARFGAGPILTFSAVNQSFDDANDSPPALFQEMGCLATSTFSGSQMPLGRGPDANSCRAKEMQLPTFSIS